jgi:hypothetical protein
MLEQLADHGDTDEGKESPTFAAAAPVAQTSIPAPLVSNNDAPQVVPTVSTPAHGLVTPAQNDDTAYTNSTRAVFHPENRVALISVPFPSIRSLDRNGQYEVTFKLGDLDLVTCQVADEARTLARGILKKLREGLELQKVTTADIAIHLHELITTPGVTIQYPPHQPTGSLWLTVADWLPNGLRGQLFPGTLCGHLGFKEAPFAAAQSLAAQLTGGDAVYFIARGRASNEVVGVQFVQQQDGELSVVAVSGLGESLRWSSVQEYPGYWRMVSRFLESVSNDPRQDLTVLGDPLVASPWSTSIRRSSVLEILGKFATNLESAWLGVPTQLLDSPVVLSPTAVNELGRGRVVSRFKFRDDNTLAVVIGSEGVRELAVSPGIKNWFGRGYWTTIWRSSGSPSLLPSSPDVQQVAKTLYSINLKSLLNGAKRVELDGFATSPLERSFELLQGVRLWLSRQFGGKANDDVRLSFDL